MNKIKIKIESQHKQENISDYMDNHQEPPDPDWQYKSILKGAFCHPEKTDKDVIGKYESSN